TPEPPNPQALTPRYSARLKKSCIKYNNPKTFIWKNRKSCTKCNNLTFWSLDGAEMLYFLQQYLLCVVPELEILHLVQQSAVWISCSGLSCA
ncbi:hypothetical protein, partial [Paenibacillus sp. IHB B 3415]|uniref:hypothetical protein n=1 Tax=Paenibacillus sp. IHB B 3415 TaxID=867080 RepID=UPI001F1CC4C8